MNFNNKDYSPETSDSQAVGVNTSGQKLNKNLPPPENYDVTFDDENQTNKEAEKAIFASADNSTTFAETEKRTFAIKLQTAEFWSKLKNINTEQTTANKKIDNSWQIFSPSEKAKNQLAALMQTNKIGNNEGITPLKEGDKNYDIIAKRLIAEKIVPANTDANQLAADLRQWNEGQMEEKSLKIGTDPKGAGGHLIGKNIYYKNPIFYPASLFNHQQSTPIANGTLSTDKKMPTRKYKIDEIQLGSNGLDNYPAKTIDILAIDPNNCVDNSVQDNFMMNQQAQQNHQNSGWNKYIQPALDLAGGKVARQPRGMPPRQPNFRQGGRTQQAQRKSSPPSKKQNNSNTYQYNPLEQKPQQNSNTQGLQNNTNTNKPLQNQQTQANQAALAKKEIEFQHKIKNKIFDPIREELTIILAEKKQDNAEMNALNKLTSAFSNIKVTKEGKDAIISVIEKISKNPKEKVPTIEAIEKTYNVKIIEKPTVVVNNKPQVDNSPVKIQQGTVTVTQKQWDKMLVHANEGDYPLQSDGTKTTVLGGAHGEASFKIMADNSIEYNIVYTFPNGVRTGNIPKAAKSKLKRIGVGQSWFPSDWSEADIAAAAEAVLNQNPNWPTLPDGPAFFGNYKGVRVGIIKTNGIPHTVIPDNAKQPEPENPNNFTINPNKIK